MIFKIQAKGKSKACVNIFIMMKTIACSALLLVLLPGSGCKNWAPAPAPITVHKIPVLTAEPASLITGPDHLAALDPDLPATGKLVVWLPGTGSSPGSASRYLKTVVSLGHHVISLAYPNANSVGSLCLNDLNRYEQVRQEICTGQDTDAGIAVTAADSIVGRLTKVLTFLADQYPGEGWDQYLSGGQPVWGSLILSGFSQGSGHAAFLAKAHEVAGVVMLGGVVDGRVEAPRQSATWITTGTWATPASRLRWFSNTYDGNWPSTSANLISLGFDPAAAVDADSGADLTGASLVTVSRDLGDQSHPSVCEDTVTPISNGSPVFQDVWLELNRF